MSCETNFCDWVSCDDEGNILVATEQTGEAVNISITNKGRTYIIEANIVDGNIVIPRSEFPLGWLSSYAGEFVLKTHSDCHGSNPICGTIETVTFTVRNGTGKSTICPCVAT